MTKSYMAPFERLQLTLVEDLRDKAHVTHRQRPLPVRDGDAGRLLAPVLERIQPKVRPLSELARDLSRVQAEDPASLLRFSGGVVEKQVIRRHANQAGLPPGRGARRDLARRLLEARRYQRLYLRPSASPRLSLRFGRGELPSGAPPVHPASPPGPRRGYTRRPPQRGPRPGAHPAAAAPPPRRRPPPPPRPLCPPARD